MPWRYLTSFATSRTPSTKVRELSLPCTLCASALTSSCHRADLTLEALNVLRLSNVSVDSERSRIHVFFTPTGKL